MDGWRKEDRWTSGEIQEAAKHTGSHNGRLRSYFTQRRIRRWATIVKERERERGRKREEGNGYSILYKNGRYTKDHGPLCRRS